MASAVLEGARTACLRAVLAAVMAGVAGCIPQPRTFIARDQRPFVRGDSTAPGPFHVAVLPLANYSTDHDAPQRLTLTLLNELAQIPGIEVVDPGAVDAALTKEPWTLLDRMPPDVADRIGAELHADALLVGALLEYGVRDGADGRIPQVSVALRLARTPGSRIVWSTVHGRDGADGEWLFGMGRVNATDQLAAEVVREALRPLAVAATEAQQPRVESQGRK
jgi:hypothetical protein